MAAARFVLFGSVVFAAGIFAVIAPGRSSSQRSRRRGSS